MRVFVALYEVVRRYGGPEEGGWYYDRTYRLHVRAFTSLSKARRWATRINSELDRPRYNRHSVCGDFDYYIRIHTSHAKVWRDERHDPRPHYE